MKLQQICLRTWYYSIKHASWSRKATWLMPLHQACQLTPWNFNSQDCYIANTTCMLCRELLCRCSCNIYACWPSVSVTTPLLFKHAYWLSTAAKWMLAGLWPLNQHAWWTFVTQYCMSAGVVLLYLLYLLVWCLTISRVFWYSSFIKLHVFVNCLSFRRKFWYVKNPPDMSTG